MNKRNGITLVALVITIIVLLILAGVTMALTFGNNGILNRTEHASKEHTKQEAKEAMNLKITNLQMKTYTEKQRLPNLQEIADGLCEDEEMEYVYTESKIVASLTKIDVGNNSSIFTKIKKYPYEFEIDSELKLASIDGVKLSTVPTSNNSNISTQFYTLNNNISINNNSENNVIFDFSNLDSGTYIINVNLYSNADTNSNIFGYLKSSEQPKSAPARFYFSGVSGYTVSNGSIVIEHTKNQHMQFAINSYCGKEIIIDANYTNAVAIKIK